MMNAIIDSEGFLNIERPRTIQAVECPFSAVSRVCGEWCALFQEPEPVIVGKMQNTSLAVPGRHGSQVMMPKNKTGLRLCNGNVLIFDRLIDKRK
jgi:hypothetical protein